MGNTSFFYLFQPWRTQNVSQHPLNCVTFAPAKIKVATPSNGLGDAFSRKYVLDR